MKVGDLLMEVVPGELKPVRDCAKEDLVAAAFTLLLSDEPDDTSWLAEALMLDLVLQEIDYPPADYDEMLETLTLALARFDDAESWSITHQLRRALCQ
jgi:hypothetical protein